MDMNVGGPSHNQPYFDISTIRLQKKSCERLECHIYKRGLAKMWEESVLYSQIILYLRHRKMDKSYY